MSKFEFSRPLQMMVTNVTSLLKTVKAVEDEHTRGTRALESSIEAIAQEIRAFDSSEAPRNKSEPEDLIRATRPITLATGKAVSAGKVLNRRISLWPQIWDERPFQTC